MDKLLTLISYKDMKPGFRIIINLIFIFWCASAFSQNEWQDINRIIAIGDLHGDYEQYLLLLKENKLINKKLRWIGGDTHLVQLGDIPDRGPDSYKIIQHLMKIQKQALKSGGRVHPIIGNHEAMNIQGDLRYVHPEEYRVHINRFSKKLQASYVNLVLERILANNPIPEDKRESLGSRLSQRFPLGFVEHRKLWEPGGKIFNWVTANKVVIKINSTLFVHGGLNPHTLPLPLEMINSTIQTELKEVPAKTDGLATAENGPLWYRGLANNIEQEELAALEKMLDYYKADRIVVAHTRLAGAIIPRFDGRVIVTDVGLSAYYGSGRANLIIENEKITFFHRGEPFLMPQREEEIIEYLENARRLDPDSSILEPYISKMRNKVRGKQPMSPAP